MGADAPYRSDGAVRIVGGGAVSFPTRLGDAAADCQNRAIITPRLGAGGCCRCLDGGRFCALCARACCGVGHENGDFVLHDANLVNGDCLFCASRARWVGAVACHCRGACGLRRCDGDQAR